MKTYPFKGTSPLLLNCDAFKVTLAFENGTIKEGSLRNNPDRTIDFVIIASDENKFNFTDFVTEWDREASQSQRV